MPLLQVSNLLIEDRFRTKFNKTIIQQEEIQKLCADGKTMDLFGIYCGNGRENFSASIVTLLSVSVASY